MWPIGIDQLASTLSRERCDVADRHRSAGIHLRACQEITPQIVMLSAAKNLCPTSRDPSLRYPETCAMAGVRPPMNSARGSSRGDMRTNSLTAPTHTRPTSLPGRAAPEATHAVQCSRRALNAPGWLHRPPIAVSDLIYAANL